MRQKIAKRFAANYFEVPIETIDKVWLEATEDQKAKWFRDADEILSLIRKEVEGIENPNDSRNFEVCRRMVKELLE